MLKQLKQLKLLIGLNQYISEIDECQAGGETPAVKKALALNYKLQTILSEMTEEEIKYYLAKSSNLPDKVVRGKGCPRQDTEKAVLAEILKEFVAETGKQPTATKDETSKDGTEAMRYCKRKLEDYGFNQYKSLKTPERKIITAIEDYKKNT